MYRKNSVRVRSLGGNIDLAKRIYSSNKTIQRDHSLKSSRKLLPLNHEDTIQCPIAELKERKKKNDEDKNENIRNLKMEEIVNLPAFKRLESESTAEDFAEKVNKADVKIRESRNKTKSFLLARYRKVSEAIKIDDKSKIACSEKKEKLDTSLVLQHQHVCPQRKIIQCKIIKCPKIPFEIPNRKKSMSGISGSKNMDFLIAQTENISEIKIQDPTEVTVPASEYFINF